MTDITVLIPVYRNQAGLNRSLESLAEAEGKFDVLVVDDGSPNPVEAPRSLRDEVPVTVLRLPRNQGIAAALNHGLRQILANGTRYIARLDAGDTVVPGRFMEQARFLSAHPRCAAVSSFVDFVDGGRRRLFCYRAPCRHESILQALRSNNCLVHSGLMLRASALQAVGLYRLDMPAAEDYELILRLSQRYTLGVLPEVLTSCEYSFEGISVADRRQQQRQRLKVQIRYFDWSSPYSFFGVARTLTAMLVPHEAVFRFKCAYLR